MKKDKLIVINQDDMRALSTVAGCLENDVFPMVKESRKGFAESLRQIEDNAKFLEEVTQERIQEYFLVEEQRLDIFQSSVNGMIKQGWQPMGSPGCRPSSESGFSPYYFQALTRPGEDKIKVLHFIIE